MLADLATAEIEDRMRSLLSYLAKLTRDPARVSPADARAVLAAGWDERALHDAVSVCALFNFMPGSSTASASPPTPTTPTRLAPSSPTTATPA